MTFRFASLLFLTAALATPAVAIAQTTIGDLQRQNSITISGEVMRVRGEDFVLNDGTGQILVEAESRAVRQVKLKPGDSVTISGHYDDSSFEALSLTLSSGEVIYVLDD